MNATADFQLEEQEVKPDVKIDDAVLMIAISRLTLSEQVRLFRRLFSVIKAQDSDVSGQLLIEHFGVQFWPMRWGDR